VASWLAVLTLGAAAQAEFPVTIEHAYGVTTIERAPVRIVTWGWGNEDALIALGVIPVGMPFQSYGGGENGIQPWIEDALEAAQAPMPVILDSSAEPPLEQIAALQPDLILAVFSGITAEQYQILSAIAPTIAYTGDAWSTPWQDVTRIAGQAVGRPQEAEQLVTDTLAFIDDTAAARPELAGTSFVALNDYNGALAVYDAGDARIRFLLDLGLVLAPSVGTLSPNDGAFYFPVSYELADRLESDIIVTYAEEPAMLDALVAKPFIRQMPQVEADALAALVGTENVASVSPPTVLSLRWGLERYADILAEAARNARR